MVDASNIYNILSHSFTVLSISDVLLDWKQLRTAHTNPHYTSGQRGSPPNQWQKGTEEMGECMKTQTILVRGRHIKIGSKLILERKISMDFNLLKFV